MLNCSRQLHPVLCNQVGRVYSSALNWELHARATSYLHCVWVLFTPEHSDAEITRAHRHVLQYTAISSSSFVVVCSLENYPEAIAACCAGQKRRDWGMLLTKLVSLCLLTSAAVIFISVLTGRHQELADEVSSVLHQSFTRSQYEIHNPDVLEVRHEVCP